MVGMKVGKTEKMMAEMLAVGKEYSMVVDLAGQLAKTRVDLLDFETVAQMA
jgi:hypothetical protein